MSALANLPRTGRIQKPPRLMVYGPQKIGKSTFAASAPNPIFIQIEDGLDGLTDPETGRPIEIPHFPQAKSLADVKAAVKALLTEEHNFQTLALDSLDWLEPLIEQQACADNNWASIETPGYGKGYKEALTHWRAFFDAMNALRDQRGMAVILIAHSEVKRYDNPMTASYDRHQPKLYKGAGALVQEWADVIGFANWETAVIEEKTTFNATQKKAKGSGRRLLYLEDRPAFMAGSRFRLPPEVPFNWGSFVQAFTAATAPQPQAA